MLLGKVRSLCKMLANVFCLFFPLKGVRPYSISYNKTPEFQSNKQKSLKKETNQIMHDIKEQIKQERQLSSNANNISFTTQA
jgi:hypothetical protein